MRTSKEFDELKEILAVAEGDQIKECVILGYAIEGLQEKVADLSKMRSEAVRSLRAEGFSVRRIGRALGISGARVEQISRK